MHIEPTTKRAKLVFRRPPALTHGRLSLGGQGVLERGGLYLLVNRTMASTCCANSRRTWGSAL
jgi:hypothetical protein